MSRLSNLCYLVFCLLSMALPLLATTPGWKGVAEEVVAHIDAAETAYRAGDQKQANRSIISAYFGVFEDRKMEAAMRLELGAKHTYLVEKQFANMRKAIRKDAGEASVAAIAQSIREAMRRDAARLDEAGIPLDVFKVKQ